GNAPVLTTSRLTITRDNVEKRPPMIAYVLTVFFACGSDCGGAPGQFTAAQQYQTHSQCDAAGLSWVSPNADPTQSLAGYQCDAVTVSAGITGTSTTTTGTASTCGPS